MTTTSSQAALIALALPALFLSHPAQSATPVSVKAAQPVLTCKTAAADGLTYTVIKAGKGAKPGSTAKVKVNYVGYLKADGTKFDDGKDVEFSLEGVIPGFAQGLQLSQPGGKYRLCIPAALGYGEAGTGPIPANADLVFEVELLSFTTPPPKPTVAEDQRKCDQVTASGLGYSVVKPGTGASPTDADMALVDLTAFDDATGIIEESALWEKIPLTKATTSFAEALKLMQVGSTYRFCFQKMAQADASMPLKNMIVTMIDLRPAPATE